MGYDMYIVGETPADEQERANAARAAFAAAVKHRDQFPRGSAEALAAQGDVDRTAREMHRADTNYFRLNISGMSRCCQIMDDAGMLKDGAPNSEDWPEFPLPDEHWDAVYEAFNRHTGADERDTPSWQEWYGPDGKYPAANLTDEQWDQARDYVKALIRHLTLHDKDTPGISAHKFGSNDGWIVTPAEIKYALNAWDNLGGDRRAAILATYGNPVWFAEWIDWLRVAEQRSGFAVH